MVKRTLDGDTFPGAQPPVEAGPVPEAAPSRPDGYRYERPHIADSAVHRLLDGLRAPRFPRSTTLPETDGQLAAHYDVGPRTVPAPISTPMPQPSVLVSTTEPPLRVDETIVIPKRRPWVALVALLAAAVGAVTLALVLVRGSAAPTVPTAWAPPTLAPLLSAPASIPAAAAASAVPSAVPAVPTASTTTLAVHPALRVWPKPAAPRREAPEPEVPRSSKVDREE